MTYKYAHKSLITANQFKTRFKTYRTVEIYFSIISNPTDDDGGEDNDDGDDDDDDDIVVIIILLLK